MRINFILPSIGLSGGARVVFEYANCLTSRGHDVSVIYPLIPINLGKKWYNLRNLARMALEIIVNLKQGVYVDWFNLKASLKRVFGLLWEKGIPDADIIVATRWETAYYVKRYSNKKGEKFYLIQHYETWLGPEEKVNLTYKLGLRNIVVSNWLKKILQNKVGAKIEAVILNGVDFNQFYPEKMEKGSDKIRILMPYREERWKGVEDGIKAFEIARKKYPEIQLVMFGPSPKKHLPRYVEFHKEPYGEKLRKIYNSCDIFLFPSQMEGCGLPPMEAMACKIPVVTTNVGAVPEYTIPGQTALVSEPGDISGLAQNLIKLIEDEDERNRIAENGYNYIKQFSWERATNQLENELSKSFNHSS
jgi:hypothetical protein